MNKILNFIIDIYRAINPIILLCTILTFGLLILEPTSIKFICSGVCVGVLICDTMNTYYRNKYK